MNNIMKLAQEYAEKCADVREYLGGNAGIDEADPYWVAMKEAEAALEAAVKQLEKDAKRYANLTDGKRRKYVWNHVLSDEEKEGHTFLEQALDAMEAK